MANLQRKPNESFKKYRARQKKKAADIKKQLQGDYFHVSKYLAYTGWITKTYVRPLELPEFD